jgi:hypothetical protein
LGSSFGITGSVGASNYLGLLSLVSTDPKSNEEDCCWVLGLAICYDAAYLSDYTISMISIPLSKEIVAF